MQGVKKAASCDFRTRLKNATLSLHYLHSTLQVLILFREAESYTLRIEHNCKYGESFEFYSYIIVHQ